METRMSTNRSLVDFLAILIVALIVAYGLTAAHNHTIHQFKFESSIIGMHNTTNEMSISIDDTYVSYVSSMYEESEEVAALVAQYLAQQYVAHKLTEDATKELLQVKTLIAELEAEGGLQFNLRREIRKRLTALEASVIDEANIIESEVNIILNELENTTEAIRAESS